MDRILRIKIVSWFWCLNENRKFGNWGYSMKGKMVFMVMRKESLFLE